MKSIKRISAALLAVFMLTATFALFAIPAAAVEDPTVERVKAAYVSCVETGDVLFTYNPEAEIFTTSFS